MKGEVRMHHSIKYKIVTATLAASILVGGISANFAPQINAAEVTSANQVATITWGVNLREGASSTTSKIRMISKGEQVTVLQIASNGWLKVKDKNGKVGYISNDKKYTEVVSSTNTTNSSTTNSNSNTSSNSSTTSSSSSSKSAKVEKVIAAGYKYLGTPYEYGSSRNNTKTFDCSDFVRQAFIDGLGVTLPSDSRKQGAYVKELGNAKTSISQLERGDLMFFMSYKGSSKSSYSSVNKSSQTITHVGIYLGDGKVLHTYSNAGGGVTTSNITNTQWEYRFLFGGSAIK